MFVATSWTVMVGWIWRDDSLTLENQLVSAIVIGAAVCALIVKCASHRPLEED